MPAIPLIGLGISAYSAYKGAKSAGQAAKAQEQMSQRQSALAQSLQTMGSGQLALSQPALQKAMEYYTKVATGNRGAINAAIAPERNQLLESYGGAEKGINARMAAGPDRDRAIAELYRQRAGQVGMMPFQAKQQGIHDMEQAGNAYRDAGLQLYGGASSALTGASNTYNQAANNRANEWAGYGSLGANASKAAQGVWDWYRNRGKKPTPGPWAGGYSFPAGEF